MHSLRHLRDAKNGAMARELINDGNIDLGHTSEVAKEVVDRIAYKASVRILSVGRVVLVIRLSWVAQIAIYGARLIQPVQNMERFQDGQVKPLVMVLGGEELGLGIPIRVTRQKTLQGGPDVLDARYQVSEGHNMIIFQ